MKPIVRMHTLALTSALATLFVLGTASVAACGSEMHRYSAAQAKVSARLETPGVVLGEFPVTKVVDGDTVHVAGLDASLRLIGLDAEETFKSKADRRMADDDFEEYLKRKRSGARRPVKAATPLGEEAKKFAIEFFRGTTTARLERDIAEEIRDRYNRYLAYVIVQKGGKELNYNVELVRAGLSPYFTKYGYSKRYHAEFVAAEAEARAAKRGIWDPRTLGYTDYEERKPWWDARADFLAKMERAFAGMPNFIVLTHWNALTQIAEHKDQEVIILGLVGEIRSGRGPTRVMLSRRMMADFPLVIFDPDVLAATYLRRWKGEFVVVRGVVSEYVNKHNGSRELQLKVTSPDQVVLSEIPGLEGTTPARFAEEALRARSGMPATPAVSPATPKPTSRTTSPATATSPLPVQ